MGQISAKGAPPQKKRQGGTGQSCALRGLGLWPEFSLPARGGVSTSLVLQTLTGPAGVPGPQAAASAVQLNRERQLCLAPWLVTADKPEGVACGSGGLVVPWHLSSRGSGVTVSPASMFPEGDPSQTTRNLQLEQETSNCSSQPCGCESVVTKPKPLGPWPSARASAPLVGMQIPGPRGRPAEPSNLGAALHLCFTRLVGSPGACLGLRSTSLDDPGAEGA